MLSHEFLFYRLAKEKERMFPKEAEAERLRRLCRRGRAKRLKFRLRSASEIDVYPNLSAEKLARLFLDKQIFWFILIYQKSLNILKYGLSEVNFMVKKDKKESCGVPTNRNMGCCKVESIISVDERGQMVLPKEIRDKTKIRAGDKLAVISWEKDSKVCCISLVKAEDLAEMVKDLLGPMMKEIMAR